MPIFNNILAGAAGQSGGAADFKIERSLRFNSGDSAYLNRTPSTAGNRRTFTFSCWVKRSALTASGEYIFTSSNSTGNNYSTLNFNSSDDKLVFQGNNGSGSLQFNLHTDAVFRDSSAWYSIVLSVDSTQATSSNRVKIYVNGQLQTFSTATYPPQNFEFRINDAQEHRIGSNESQSSYLDAYLADVHFIDGQALAPTDFGEYDDNNVWQPKAYSGTYGTNGFHLDFSDNSSNAALGDDSSGNNNDWAVNNFVANRNEPYAHYWSGTFLAGEPGENAFDGSSVSAARPDSSQTVTWTHPTGIAFTKLRIRAGQMPSGTAISVNGTNVTSSYSTKATVDLTSAITSPLTTISVTASSTEMPKLFFVEVNDVVLVSGHNTDVFLDSPINYEASSGNNGGNYATLNPLDKASTHTTSNGNLQLNINQTRPTFATTKSTFGVSSGKFYWEFVKETSSAGGLALSGIWPTDETSPTLTTDLPANIGSYTDLVGFGANDGNAQFRLMPSGSSSSGSYTEGQVIGIAFDADAGKFYAFVNGSEVSGQNISAGTSVFDTVTVGKTYVPFAYNGNGGSGTENVETTFNFGQRPFAYTPPTGFKSLCTQNLDDPLIEDGSTAMDVALWTGNSTARDITGFNMSPDLVWIKKRASAAYNFGNHHLFDTVRGATKALISNDTQKEQTETTQLTAFNSDGFSLGTSPSSNATGDTYVAWSWDAGNSNTSISAGDLNSTVYNQSQSWSSYGDTNDKSAEAWEDIFDGNEVATPHMVAQSGKTAVWTPTTAISFTKLELYANNDGFGDITLNGNISTTGTIPAGGGANIGWADVTSLILNNTLTSIEVPNAYNTDPTRLGGIRIDGKLLADSGVTVTNVPAVASTHRANQSTGFSIVKVDNPTATESRAHGLNKKPDLIICKSLASADSWHTYHSSLGYKKYINLNGTGAAASSDQFGSQEPNSNLFYVKPATGSGANKADGMIYYIWTAVEGYSAFGSYEGNGSTDGPFVYTGFRPAFLIIKASSSTGNWHMHDTSRSIDNPAPERLFSNLSNSEQSTTAGNIDILSNGFKLKNSTTGYNANNVTHIWIAFAEHPFKTARAR